jgi:hypothetical protein
MSEQPNTQQKEIDLLDVMGRIFSGIGKGIQNLFSWIKRVIIAFVRLALKHWWILLIAIILGGAVGHFKTNWAKPYFQTEMLVETGVVSRIQIADRINSLQKMISDGNNVALAQQLSLRESKANAIFFIRADITEIRVEGRPTRTVIRRDRDGVETEVVVEEPNPQFVRVRVRLRENEGISGLGQAIVSFVENDAFIAERVVLAKQMNLSQQEAIDLEIQQLVLFQRRNIEKSPLVMTAGSSPLMVVNEERTYTTEILDLRNQLAALQRDYELLRPMFVIQPFTPFENPVDKRVRNILLFAFIFFAGGYSFLLFREGWNRV